MTALLLDVGNTRIKWGLLVDGTIQKTGHIAQERIRDKGLQVLTGKLPRRVDEVFVSNVAGASFATRLSGVVGVHCDCDVRFARSQKKGWGLKNSYAQPRRMGVDRWVAMVGAWAEVQSACLVIDVGTALTLDAIDDTGAHLVECVELLPRLGCRLVPAIEHAVVLDLRPYLDVGALSPEAELGAIGLHGQNPRQALPKRQSAIQPRTGLFTFPIENVV